MYDSCVMISSLSLSLSLSRIAVKFIFQPAEEGPGGAEVRAFVAFAVVDCLHACWRVCCLSLWLLDVSKCRVWRIDWLMLLIASCGCLILCHFGVCFCAVYLFQPFRSLIGVSCCICTADLSPCCSSEALLHFEQPQSVVPLRLFFAALLQFSASINQFVAFLSIVSAVFSQLMIKDGVLDDGKLGPKVDEIVRPTRLSLLFSSRVSSILLCFVFAYLSALISPLKSQAFSIGSCLRIYLLFLAHLLFL